MSVKLVLFVFLSDPFQKTSYERKIEKERGERERKKERKLRKISSFTYSCDDAIIVLNSIRVKNSCNWWEDFWHLAKLHKNFML